MVDVIVTVSPWAFAVAPFALCSLTVQAGLQSREDRHLEGAASKALPLHECRGDDCPSITAALVDLMRAKPISRRDLDIAAGLVLDAVGSVIAGRNSIPGRKLLAWSRDQALGSGPRIPDAGRLAFLLGGLCHILERDDLHRASVVHPGCVVVPAVMALGIGTDGRTALAAVLHGYEAACRVGQAVGAEHYRIWHNTATCGPFGSALAAARLLDLDRDQTVHALGNAGSQSAGLWEFIDTGAETKHLHAARAAEAGVVAAQLALHGFTGAPRILDGERGFFRAMCPDGDPGVVLADPDAPWQVHLTSIKPWPSCRHTHPAIDAARRSRAELDRRGVSIANVSGIKVATYRAALALCDRPQPDTAYQAKFSLQHCVAAALVDGNLDLSSFDDAARQRVREISARVIVREDGEFERAYPQNWGSRIILQLPDGSEVSVTTTDARGDPELPLSRDELARKADALLRHGGVSDPAPLIEAVLAMPDGDSVPDLTRYVFSAAA